MTTIQAIETEYNGYRFRSRLEARWAVFFDACGIEYQYEIDGYDVDGKYYLPDFFLPETKTFVEVKGDWDECDWRMILRTVDYGGSIPHVGHSKYSNRGLLLLGEIPNILASLNPLFIILQHHKGVEARFCKFHYSKFFVEEESNGPFWIKNNWFDALITGNDDERIRSLVKEFSGKAVDGDLKIDETTRTAFKKARQARFEHGQTPTAH